MLATPPEQGKLVCIPSRKRIGMDAAANRHSGEHHQRGIPPASFQATLFACARRLTTPVVYLGAALAHKKEAKRRLATPSMFGEDPPPGELRAVNVIPNKEALQERFTIPTNIRVFGALVIHRLFDTEPLTNGDGNEDLSQWESQGKTLKRRAMPVKGRKVADRVIAIGQPVEQRRRRM